MNHLNEAGVTTLYSYNALNQLTGVKDALNQTTRYSYDGNGQIAKVTVQGKGESEQTLNTKSYNEIGLMTTKQDAAAQSESVSYNNLGQQTGKTDRMGSVFSYNYDERGQLKSSSVSGVINNTSATQKIDVIYGDGSPKYRTINSYVNGTVRATQKRYLDSMNQVRNDYSVGYSSTSAGGHSSYILNELDVLGRMTQINDYNLGFYVNYQFDSQRLINVQTNGSASLSKAASDNVQYSYYANGRVKTITYPPLTDGSILKTEYTYNKALGWVESMKNTKGSSVLSGYNYSYDHNGNITAVTEVLNNGAAKTTSYGYDALNRLLSIKRPNGQSTQYTYDVRGNRLTSSESVSTSLDLSDTSYTYDLQNTLTGLTKNGNTTSFTYYADGLRYLKSTGTTHTQVNYDFSGQVIAEEKLSGSTVIQKSSFVRGDRVLVKKDKTAAKDYYYLYNGHGDVVQIVNNSGTPVNTYSYDEWGNITSQTEGIPNSFKYAGEIYDEETGLYYLRARYYDPSIGRFLNEDTVEGQIDNPLSQNLYTYVGNNPLIRFDPSGNSWISDQWNAFIVDMKTVHASWETAMGYWTMGFTDPFFTSAKVSMDSKEYWYAQAEVIFNTATLGIGNAEKQAIKQGSKELTSVVRLVKNPCNCFTAGTKVQTDEGEKPIEEIEVGDKVLAKDDETGEMAYKEVEWLFQRDVEETYNITVGDEVITTTDEHPFWIVGKGWVEAQHLVVGYVLTTSDGKELAIEKIEVKKEHKTVYNFMVKDFHTYFVSNLGIWTHNACKPINLPSYKSIEIDMDHIISGHTKGGSRATQSKIKDLFPDNMNNSQIEKAVRDAYSNSSKLQTQGDRVLVRGQSNGLTIEMWVNTSTKAIETAYPVFK
ncbi:polymorphic toxin-type HINT domain-containing protein [Paenibacillus sp. sgz500992]|uniref:polymorphic toxin-type HINT domain-containing protein n=1 Tax=Paenibacillus sp. sgz500992 TaxID=3242476 RepID=UPI0036D3ED31